MKKRSTYFCIFKLFTGREIIKCLLLFFIIFNISCISTSNKKLELDARPAKEKEVKVKVEEPAQKLAGGLARAFNIKGQEKGKDLKLGIIINFPSAFLKEEFTEALKKNLKENFTIKDLKTKPDEVKTMNHISLRNLAQEEDVDALVVGTIKEKEDSYRMWIF